MCVCGCVCYGRIFVVSFEGGFFFSRMSTGSSKKGKRPCNRFMLRFFDIGCRIELLDDWVFRLRSNTPTNPSSLGLKERRQKERYRNRRVCVYMYVTSGKMRNKSHTFYQQQVFLLYSRNQHVPFCILFFFIFFFCVCRVSLSLRLLSMSLLLSLSSL